MEQFIEAFTIFLKYDTGGFPTLCEHDELYVMVNPASVSDADITRLEELGFDADNGSFRSSVFGSA
jgi:hypothetical protein